MSNSSIISTHVSNAKDDNDDRDTQYVVDQTDIINQRYDTIHPQDAQMGAKKTFNPSFNPNAIIDNQMRTDNTNSRIESTRYDPYLDFLFKNGLIKKDNNVRYNVNYINIDSGARESKPVAETEFMINLENNPLRIEDDRIWIKQQNHTFVPNDQILLTGLQTKIKELRTYTGATYGIKFTPGLEYAEINLDPNITVLGAGVGYDTSNMFVTISELKGFPTSTHIGNIPINFINRKQRVILVLPGSTNISQSKFYIKLPNKFDGSQSTTGYNIKIEFHYYGGIKVNEINAEYPIDNNHLKGFHLISEIRKNEYSIKLPRKGFLNGQFGGSNIYVSKVKKINGGSPTPSQYNIKLGRTYNNVVMIRMVSSEFPNTEKVFHDTPSETRNNRLYFQNLEDGDTIYTAEIESGNYSPTDLKTAIEDSFKKVERVLVASNSTYSKSNFITVTIDTNTDIVTMESYKEAKLSKPISDVSPPIDPKPVTDPGKESYTITIKHNSHGLNVGDSITISNYIEHMGIPTSVINATQTITKIIDTNNYEFIVEHFNLNNSRISTFGGQAVVVHVPNIMRFRFDIVGNMGNELGFRDINKQNAVTPYGTIHINKDLYEDEIDTDELGNKRVIKNNSLQLSGNNYIIMTCRQFSPMLSFTSIKDIFAKINLTGLPGRVLYNTFVSTPFFFYDPIYELSELDVAFYDPLGELYNFNGIDHSYTLEVVTIDETPKGTGISSDIGQEH